MLYNFVTFYHSEKEGKATPFFPLCHGIILAAKQIPGSLSKDSRVDLSAVIDWLSICPSSFLCCEDESLMDFKMERKESLPGEI